MTVRNLSLYGHAYTFYSDTVVMLGAVDSYVYVRIGKQFTLGCLTILYTTSS